MAMLSIRCWKASKFYDIDLDAVPERVYKEALILGMRELLNRGLNDVSLELRSPATYDKLAKDNLLRILTGDIRFSRSA